MDKFFLSYSRTDQEFALRLATDLRWAGCPVWVDQFDILPSQLWDRAVEAAVRECTGLLLVLSPRSVASENVLDEVSVAIDSRKRIVPVLYQPCVLPLRLSRVQFIDATKDYDAALERCKVALGAGAGEAAAAASPPPAPEISTPLRVPLAPELTAKAEKLLTAHLGPIAAVLVQKAATQAADQADLFGRLAAAIPHERERAAFMRQAGIGAEPAAPDAAAAPAPAEAQPVEARPALDPALINKIAGVLTFYLGPVAGHLVRREHQNAADPEDLFNRLSARIPNSRERAELLQKLRALQ